MHDQIRRGFVYRAAGPSDVPTGLQTRSETLRDPRAASIAALAEQINGRMEGEGEGSGAAAGDPPADPPATPPAGGTPPPANNPTPPTPPPPTAPPTRHGGGNPPPPPAGTDSPAGAPPATEPEGQGDDPDKLKRALDSERELRKAAEKATKDAEKRAAMGDEAHTAAEEQRKALLDQLAETLGFKPTEEAPPDPAALQQAAADKDREIEALRAERRANHVELAAWRSASRLGANVAELLDRRSFMTAVGSLDPAADDFTSGVDDAVKKALEENPALRLNQTPSPAAAGIGARGADAAAAAAVAPGNARIRAAYGPS